MSENTVFSQPAFILHQRHYRESSLIIDALTRDYGRLSLIAKGVRKAKSKTAGILRPFALIALSYVGKTSLKTITDAEILLMPIEFKGLALYCGFYINELVCHFLHKYDPHPEVFLAYQDCLSMLAANENHEAALRTFELNLMENIGYGVNLSYDLHHDKPIELTRTYQFNKDLGLVEDVRGTLSGSALIAMSQRKFDDLHVLNEAKLLLRMVIDSHLQGKPLKSRAVINTLLKRA